MLSQNHLPPSLVGSALARSWSVLEPDGIGFARHGGIFWQLLTEATPVAPLLPKPGHKNPIQLFHFVLLLTSPRNSLIETNVAFFFLISEILYFLQTTFILFSFLSFCQCFKKEHME